MSVLSRIRRELIVIFSKICLKSASNDYLGLKLNYPIIYGMGRGYVIPKELWMGHCLDAFIQTKPGCVVDVGVNVGVYLVKLKVLSDEVDYYGFEPNAVCNYYTNELIRMNGFMNARVLPLALSDEMNVMTLYAGRMGDKGASLIHDVKCKSNLEYSSTIVTVKGDDFIDLLGVDKISVVKVDVEGAEYEVLSGLLKTIDKFRPFFYIEIWASYADGESNQANERIPKIYDLITSRDYTVLNTNRQSELEIKKTSQELFDQYDPNYLFIPNELLDAFKDCVNKIKRCEIKA